MDRIAAAVLLVVVPVSFNVTFFVLQRRFDYPDILRSPTDEILRRFQAGGSSLRLLWYAFAFSALLFIPVPVLVHQLFAPAPWYLAVGTVFGVIAGVVQVVGLLRWPFVVGGLAAAYSAPGVTADQRAAIGVVFDTIHRYGGVAIGEHLGYFFTALWTLILCIAIIATGIVSPILGWAGIVPALAIVVGLFEETGFGPAGMINAIGYVLWSIWLVALGVLLLV
jgi:hypothetical protein